MAVKINMPFGTNAVPFHQIPCGEYFSDGTNLYFDDGAEVLMISEDGIFVVENIRLETMVRRVNLTINVEFI